MQCLQASFRTTPLTCRPDKGGIAGAKIDCELTDGIAGVVVKLPLVERNTATHSPAATAARATNEIDRNTAADMGGDRSDQAGLA